MSNEIMVKIGTRLSEADPKEVGWSQAQPPKVEVQAQAYTYAGACPYCGCVSWSSSMLDFLICKCCGQMYRK
jgi:hypothetical protein